MNKVNVKDLERFLRKRLEIPRGIEVLIVPNNHEANMERFCNNGIVGHACSSVKHPGKKYYIIYRHDLMGSELIKTVCHEMVHVQQLVEKRWVDAGDVGYWYNRKVEIPKNSYGTKAEHDLPWEIEAFDLEKKLEKEYKVYLDSSTWIKIRSFFGF